MGKLNLFMCSLLFLKPNSSFSNVTFLSNLHIFLLEDSFLSIPLLLLLVASIIRNLSGKYWESGRKEKSKAYNKSYDKGNVYHRAGKRRHEKVQVAVSVEENSKAGSRSQAEPQRRMLQVFKTKSLEEKSQSNGDR